MSKDYSTILTELGNTILKTQEALKQTEFKKAEPSKPNFIKKFFGKKKT